MPKANIFWTVLSVKYYAKYFTCVIPKVFTIILLSRCHYCPGVYDTTLSSNMLVLKVSDLGNSG
jgi:hypothetical protein